MTGWFILTFIAGAATCFAAMVFGSKRQRAKLAEQIAREAQRQQRDRVRTSDDDVGISETITIIKTDDKGHSNVLEFK